MFARYYWKNSPVRPSCDSECKKRLICDTKSGRSHARKHFCSDVESKIDEGKSWKAWFYKGINYSYVAETLDAIETVL